MLGIIDGMSLFPKLVPKSIAGLPVCSLVKDSSGSFYTFVGSDGSELGKAGYLSGPGTFEVKLSSSIDLTTKLLPILLTTAYFIVSEKALNVSFHLESMFFISSYFLCEQYMLFYVETTCGPIGMSGIGKRMCVCFLLFPIVFFLIILTIVLSVID